MIEEQNIMIVQIATKTPSQPFIDHHSQHLLLRIRQGPFALLQLDQLRMSEVEPLINIRYRRHTIDGTLLSPRWGVET